MVFCQVYGEVPECLGGIVNCAQCHESTAPPAWNAYGLQLIEQLDRERSFEVALLAALESVALEDSDGDGESNEAEILAGTAPGDARSRPEPPSAPLGPPNPGFEVGEYDFRFALRRASITYCGRSPSYEELAAVSEAVQEATDSDAAARRLLHEAVSACLASDYFRDAALARLADKRIRPVFAIGADTEVFIGDQRLVIGDYHYDYRLWSYLLTGDRDMRELLTADYHIAQAASGELVRVEGVIPRADEGALAGGQPLLPERRAGMLTTQWFLTINTMFSGLPRTTAAQAYRSYLGADIARSDGIRPVAGEPADIDQKGVDGEVCAQCHSTLDPLAYAFAKYQGIDDGYSGGFGVYDPTRPQRYLPGWSDGAQQAWLFGTPVSDLVEFARVAAESDEFKRNMAQMFFEHALGRGPREEEREEFVQIWQSLPEDGYSAWRLIHRLVDTRAFGVP